MDEKRKISYCYWVKYIETLLINSTHLHPNFFHSWYESICQTFERCGW